MWPRFQLTPAEAKYNSKYEDPTRSQRGALRRAYYHELSIAADLRADMVAFQISRRCRVFGITGAGDVSDLMIELIDSVGEQYTAGPVHLTNLLTGFNPDPLGGDAGVPPYTGQVRATAPTGVFIQEPNIALAPNQTLTIKATPSNPAEQTLTHLVGLTLHVWEFPGSPGSPL